jgi:hypothetical protein
MNQNELIEVPLSCAGNLFSLDIPTPSLTQSSRNEKSQVNFVFF